MFKGSKSHVNLSLRRTSLKGGIEYQDSVFFSTVRLEGDYQAALIYHGVYSLHHFGILTLDSSMMSTGVRLVLVVFEGGTGSQSILGDFSTL